MRVERGARDFGSSVEHRRKRKHIVELLSSYHFYGRLSGGENLSFGNILNMLFWSFGPRTVSQILSQLQ